MTPRHSAILLAAIGCFAFAAAAQETEPAQPEPREDPTPPTPQDIPDLDDLLGIPPPRERPERPEAPDPTRQQLDERLAGEQPGDNFTEAVRLMGRSAERLQDARDTGIATQRLQEETIKRLDALIASAKKNRSQSQSSSPRPQEQSRPQPAQPQQGGQQGRQGDEAGESNIPPQPANPKPGIDSEGADWGSLPARVRDALSQGRSDSFSSLYRAMTESYYRRLAEEAGKDQ